MITNKKREDWIDISKTLLIFSMVVGHCQPDSWLRTLIYGCHMPAFFMISGYHTVHIIGKRPPDLFLYHR